MIEELEALAKAIAGLPSLAVWALVGFLIYKLSVIGSIYGVIHVAIDRLYQWAVRPKAIEYEFKGVRMVAPDAVSAILVEVMNRGSKNKNRVESFFYSGDIEWLEAAVAEKIAKDEADGVRR